MLMTTYLMCVGFFALGWFTRAAFARDDSRDTIEQAYLNLRNGRMRSVDEQELRDAADFDRDFQAQTRAK